MKTTTPSLEALKAELEKQLPEYSYRPARRTHGKCIVAKKTNFSGAAIYVKKDFIEVRASIPETWALYAVGSGAIFMRWFSPAYSEPQKKITAYLSSRYSNVAGKGSGAAS